ncbi:MAG: hypothetical protein H8E66_14145 [Planctomycetes bacterium]|nr:hypothetical protein [Planctomycetota bacterium]
MNRFAALAITPVVAAVITLATSLEANEIGFIEDFALAKDRTEALKRLIPGSEEYYYFNCLHLQNTEKFDQVEELLAAWIKRYNYTPLVRQIQTRQALLTYEREPEKSLEFIRRQLGIEFNHQRETLGEKPNLPTQLNQKLISREHLSQIAKVNHKDLSGFTDAALDWLVATDLDPDRRRHLLQRLARPDHPNLAKLIVDDLNYRNSKPFGSMAIHTQLLTEQLDECLRLKPDLLNQANFVNAYLSKLHPSDDVEWQHETDEYEAYLDRMWRFVSRLAPVHNSLKTHVLFHRLTFDRARGSHDKDRFMTYIRLPRNVAYIEPKFLQSNENRRYAADLNANFEAFTLLPPVRNDEPLIRSYFHHFFVNETATKPYEPFISDTYLRHNLAETKIVNGLGEPEQWYSLLPPDRYQALKDRIDLDFAPTNPKFFTANDPVSLDLHVKNVETLIVRVFEINTKNYYREHKREVNADINLDGMVANNEQTFAYKEPPLRRARRHFDFPALTKPGVYVVDFIGNGMNSRVVVRKGQLRHLVQTTSSGQLFTVLDEKNERVQDASIWLAGHEYLPEEDGRILVPFSTQPGRQPIILSRGDFSSLAFFQHQAENYQLAAGIYVDRESLLKRTIVPVVVRPGLYLNGSPVGIADLEDVRLTIASVDHDGVSSTKEVKDFKLFEDRESIYEFQVPPRLSQLTFTLQAKIQSLSQSKKIDLQAADTYQLNEIDKSEKVACLYFAKINDVYVVESRGKSGESRPDRPVVLSLQHRDFSFPMTATVQTDHTGTVALGPLEGVVSVTATDPDGTAQSWSLSRDEYSYHQSIHAAAGATIEIPYMGARDKPARDELSLLEVRGKTFVADRFNAIRFKGGMLQLRGLPRGDYDLLLKDRGHSFRGHRIRVRVADGKVNEGYALGSSRHLESRRAKPLQIASIERAEDQLRILVNNSTKFSRVHIYATRYRPAFSVFSKLVGVVDPEPYQVDPGQMTSLYVAGRSIGDEYQYIIDRRYAKKYPGVLVERPSVLLNPWAVRKTESGKQDAQTGDDFAPSAEPSSEMSQRAAAAAAQVARRGDFANLDFLGEASVVLANLQPDKDGIVVISLDELGSHQDLHIVAVDPQSTVYRNVSLDEKPMKLVDQRLLTGLDPERHFTQQKRVSVVAKGEQFVLPDIATSRFEAYDTLPRVYSVYATLSGDPKLAEFRFILNWPNLKTAEKQALYSKYACHELNFFLLKKDRKFFDQIVRPYLTNKRDKTLLDDWLLQYDLEEYLRAWNYSRLNIAERILLSQRVADDRQHTTRDVLDQFSLLTPDTNRLNQLFLTAVKGRALEASDHWGFEAAKDGFISNLMDVDMDVDVEASSVPLMRGRAGVAYGGAAAPAGAAADKLFGAVPAADDSSESELIAGKPAAKRRALSVRPRIARERASVAGDYLSYYSRLGRKSGRVRALYELLDKTQEWAENNYYHLPIEQQLAGLVSVNAFWRDYAEHDPRQPFRSTNFADASRNFTEMMLALSLLDLPFESAEHATDFADGKMTLTAGSPMIVFHEEIREASEVVEQTPILVSQNFFRHNDRYRQINNERLDKFVTDEFLVHTVYGCQVVLTNPTSSPQKLDVLLQVPLGAIPVLNGHETRSVQLDLQPYNTQTVEYHFYFPAAGRYPHYPVHIAKNEQLLAHADATTLTVVEKLSRIDRESWPYLSQYGSAEDVLEYLRQNNLHQTNLDKIAFRMGNKAFFLEVVELLERRHAYNHTLWSYGIKHNDMPAISQYLQHADGFVQLCGAAIDTPLLRVDPIARHSYQHLDYRPLVNARAHQLGRRRQILNARLHQQYHQLLTILSCGRDLSQDDLMAVTYYLLLQDRVAEAMDFFSRVNAADLTTSLQHDYFTAYLNLYRADTDAAREITSRYAGYPIDRWRNAFVSIDRQLDEISSGDVELVDPENRDQRQAELAATAPSFDLKVEAKKVQLDYQNLERVLVNYYLMDIELLFSRNPFVQHSSGQFSQILPNLTDTIELPARGKKFEFALPNELLNRNVLVELVGAGQTKSQAYFSNSLSVQLIENYGQLRVTAAGTGKPLSTVYAKAYARMKDGSVRFFKDGYTDLRGRFDYSSLNTNELDNVERFALLILSEEHGAIVREATPPKR